MLLWIGHNSADKPVMIGPLTPPKKKSDPPCYRGGLVGCWPSYTNRRLIERGAALDVPMKWWDAYGQDYEPPYKAGDDPAYDKGDKIRSMDGRFKEAVTKALDGLPEKAGELCSGKCECKVIKIT